MSCESMLCVVLCLSSNHRVDWIKLHAVRGCYVLLWRRFKVVQMEDVCVMFCAYNSHVFIVGILNGSALSLFIFSTPLKRSKDRKLLGCNL